MNVWLDEGRMNTKKKLQAFFDAPHDKAQYIHAYEENKAFFDELIRTGRWEEIDFVIPIKLWKYADPLGQTGQYSKALRVLTEVEAALPKLRGRTEWYAMYEESLTFLKAVNLSRLKRYKESNVLFQKLLKGKQVNERYADWYRSNLKSMASGYLEPAMIIGSICLVLSIVAGWMSPAWKVLWLQTTLLVVVLVLWVGQTLHGYWIDRTSQGLRVSGK